MDDSARFGQVGGDHYKKLAIQPFEMGLRNAYDVCIFTALKYVSRHKDKAGEPDLRKAKHTLRFREEHYALVGLPVVLMKPPKWVAPERYSAANRLPAEETMVMMLLDRLAYGPWQDEPTLTDMICYYIDKIIERDYSGETL